MSTLVKSGQVKLTALDCMLTLPFTTLRLGKFTEWNDPVMSRFPLTAAREFRPPTVSIAGFLARTRSEPTVMRFGKEMFVSES
jgi:hypothetical protein